jgi:hypothetical protein
MPGTIPQLATYNITVPPYGGRVALVNFIILGTYDTSLTANTEIDDEAWKILNNFWTDSRYRDGITQQHKLLRSLCFNKLHNIKA